MSTTPESVVPAPAVEPAPATPETPVVPVVTTDLETQTVLTNLATVLGKTLTEEALGSVFAWAAAQEDQHVKNLVTIADSGNPASIGALVQLVNRFETSAITKPVGSKLSDRVLKRAMSHTAQVPVIDPEVQSSAFVANESAAIINQAKTTGRIPTATEIVARLKLNEGTN